MEKSINLVVKTSKINRKIKGANNFVSDNKKGKNKKGKNKKGKNKKNKKNNAVKFLMIFVFILAAGFIFQFCIFQETQHPHLKIDLSAKLLALIVAELSLWKHVTELYYDNKYQTRLSDLLLIKKLVQIFIYFCVSMGICAWINIFNLLQGENLLDFMSRWKSLVGVLLIYLVHLVCIYYLNKQDPDKVAWLRD